MFCIIAFVVLSILGIFSASNRQLAREALDCVLRRVTFRPCNTGFDEKMKAKLLGFVITRSENGARLLNKYFEPIAWVFFVLLMASSFMAVRGMYLYYTTGNCNGANQSGFCVFDPKNQNNQVSAVNAVCRPKSAGDDFLTLDGVDLNGFPVLDNATEEKIYFIGCYHCEYTRKTYPIIRKLVDRYQTDMVFMHYPVKESTDTLSRLGYCAYKAEPTRYWDLNDRLFEAEAVRLDDPAVIDGMLTDSGFDSQEIRACMAAHETETTVQGMLKEVVKSQFYGTPTIFIGEDVYVGPKPYRVYAISLKGLLYWLR
jgi:hypothetical protein